MMRLLKNILRVNLIVSLFAIISASINIDLAKSVAENIIIERSNNNNSIKDSFIDSSNGVDNFYIFNLLPRGFVIISANENIIPIIGYSFNKDIDYDNLPPQLNEVLDSYRKNISFIINNNIASSLETQNLWKRYTNNFIREESIREVSPLITAMWNQGGEW